MDRFKDLLWFNNLPNYTVSIIGIGGIGSWTAFLLAKAGAYLKIIDPDEVESVNTSGQLYAPNQVGYSKVSSLAQIISTFSGIYVEEYQDYACNVTGIYSHSKIVILGVDNMRTRKEVFDFLRPNIEKEETLLIDGRLLAEQFQIFILRNAKDAELYSKEYLFSDEEVPDAPCTAKQTSHFAAGIAFNITRFITNYVLIKEQKIPAYLPFKYEINGTIPDIISLKTE